MLCVELAVEGAGDGYAWTKSDRSGSAFKPIVDHHQWVIWVSWGAQQRSATMPFKISGLLVRYAIKNEWPRDLAFTHLRIRINHVIRFVVSKGVRVIRVPVKIDVLGHWEIHFNCKFYIKTINNLPADFDNHLSKLGYESSKYRQNSGGKSGWRLRNLLSA